MDSSNSVRVSIVLGFFARSSSLGSHSDRMCCWICPSVDNAEGEQRGDDIRMDIRVTLEDLYQGRMFEVLVKNQILCPKCHGSGARSENDVTQCHHCQGRGVKITMHSIGPGFMQQVQSTCDHCSGTGKLIKHKCSECSGKKVVAGERTLDVYIERGMADGHTIEFEHQADEKPNSKMSAGHIIFKLTTLEHDVFKRSGNDLHMEYHITLLEALTGFKRTFKHLDGHVVNLSRKTVTSPGDVMRVSGEGMPIHNYASKSGDLLVKLIVDFPTALTQQQKDGFSKIL